VYATAALSQALGTAMKSANKAIKGPIFIAGMSKVRREQQNCSNSRMVADN
jgi:hypothetical protein